jgi:3-oxoacyl-[acyl-carrier protein] reductase
VQAESYACDLAHAREIERAAGDILSAQGAPTVVVHNAAALERGPKVHEIDPQVWDHILGVNLRAPFILTRALLPAMLAAQRGRVLFIGSISSRQGCPTMAHYGAAKWGLVGLMRSLSDELAGTGLMSLAILPGSVDTDMLKQTPFTPDMTADEVAAVITFYALDAPRAVAGATVEVFGR